MRFLAFLDLLRPTGQLLLGFLWTFIYLLKRFFLLWFFFWSNTNIWDQKSAVTSGMPTPRRCRTLLCHSLIVTLHARLFNTLSSQSLMEIGSFSKHNDELCLMKGALSARTFSSFCPAAQRAHLLCHLTKLSPLHACQSFLSPTSPITQ